jgi:hypothetical protein
MRKIKTMITVGLFGFFAVGSAIAQDAMSPEGIWQPANKESRYKITYCGDDNTKLCGLVHWIQPEHQNAENTALLGTYLFSELPMRAQNKWRGKITLKGHTIRGNVTQLSADKLKVSACMLIWCEEITLDKYSDL